EADRQAERLSRFAPAHELQRLSAETRGLVRMRVVLIEEQSGLGGQAAPIVELAAHRVHGFVAADAELADEAGAITGRAQKRRVGLAPLPLREGRRKIDDSVPPLLLPAEE